MKLAIDVQYHDDRAVVAGLLFQEWDSNEIVRTVVVEVDNIAPYEPGAFYKRELPCILALLKQVSDTLDVIIVDGFVTLGAAKEDGLGMHLYRALNGATPIIGVAKKAFDGTPKDDEIYRGDSRKPLYVSSVGVAHVEAKGLIEAMHGDHRMPSLLKRVDQVCRGIDVDHL